MRGEGTREVMKDSSKKGPTAQRAPTRRALLKAMKGGKFEQALELLNAGADPLSLRGRGKKVTELAICKGILWCDTVRMNPVSYPASAPPSWSRLKETLRKLCPEWWDATTPDLEENFAFVSAIWDLDVQRATELVTAGADVNSTFDLFETVRWSVTTGKAPAAVRLLSRVSLDIIVNRRKLGIGGFKNTRCTLFLLSLLRHLDVVDDISINYMSWSFFHSDEDDVRMKAGEQIFEALADSGGDANTIDGDGTSTLLWAAAIGIASTVEKLIEMGANVDARDVEGRTALMHAAKEDFAFSEYTAVYRSLLRAGADVDAADKTGATAVAWVARDGKPELVTQLIEAGANVNTKDSQGKTPLMEAMHQSFAESQYEEVTECLVDAGADANTRDHTGKTALIHLVLEDFGGNLRISGLTKEQVREESIPEKIPFIDTLAKAGADLNLRDATGKTALDWATERKEGPVVDRLIELGARR